MRFFVPLLVGIIHRLSFTTQTTVIAVAIVVKWYFASATQDKRNCLLVS